MVRKYGYLTGTEIALSLRQSSMQSLCKWRLPAYNICKVGKSKDHQSPGRRSISMFGCKGNEWLAEFVAPMMRNEAMIPSIHRGKM